MGHWLCRWHRYLCRRRYRQPACDPQRPVALVRFHVGPPHHGPPNPRGNEPPGADPVCECGGGGDANGAGAAPDGIAAATTLNDRPTNDSAEDVATGRLPWINYVPGALLAATMWILWIPHGFAAGGMRNWGVSAEILRAGGIETVALHMFAHGSVIHIAMNTAILFELGAATVYRLGAVPRSWFLFFGLFVMSGLAGMLVYLAIHPFGNLPMLGATGAIYGLFGMLVRVPPGSPPIAFRSPEMKDAAKDFLKDNLWMFAIFTVPLLLQGRSGGVAWEAHLGGFLFGLFFGPRLVSTRAEPA
jgi:membrane associated rhomboid family serine protease